MITWHKSDFSFLVLIGKFSEFSCIPQTYKFLENPFLQPLHDIHGDSRISSGKVQLGDFQAVLVVRNPPSNAGDISGTGSIPESGRSYGRGHGNPLQYSCLENPMDRGAWWASPWGRSESDTTEQLHFHFHALEKAMATHSSALAWRIPGTGEPGRLLSMGSHRVRHDWSNLAATAPGTSIQFTKVTVPTFISMYFPFHMYKTNLFYFFLFTH